MQTLSFHTYRCTYTNINIKIHAKNKLKLKYLHKLQGTNIIIAFSFKITGKMYKHTIPRF